MVIFSREIPPWFNGEMGCSSWYGFVDLQMVTALSIAGDLSFNPETDSLTGKTGEK